MMKKMMPVLAVALVLTMCIGMMAACGSKDETDKENNTTGTTTKPTTGTTTKPTTGTTTKPTTGTTTKPTTGTSTGDADKDEDNKDEADKDASNKDETEEKPEK